MARFAFVGVCSALIWCATTVGQSVPPDATSRTFKMSLAFDRNDLSKVLDIIADTIEVPIEIVARDFQSLGVTRNQSMGLDERDRSVEDLLKVILLKANPDGKLAYTVKKDAAGVETVYIVGKQAAEQRGEVLFPEFKLSTLRPQRQAPADAPPPFRWSSLIRATTLEAEIRRQVAALEPALQVEDHRPSRAVIGQLAALFKIVEEHDQQVRWKADARRIVHDLSTNKTPSFRGRFTQLHGYLQGLMNGGAWPESPDIVVAHTWQIAAPRWTLMRRFDAAMQQHFLKWDGTEAALVDDRDAIRHDAEVVAAFAHVVRYASYGYAEDPDYDRCAALLEAQARNVPSPLLHRELPELRALFAGMQGSCTACHQNYR